MKATLSAVVVLAFALGMVGCSEPVAPDVTQTISITSQQRLAIGATNVPALGVTAQPGAISFTVTSRAVCGKVEAGISRIGGEIAVTANLFSEPAWLCVDLTNWVVDYSGTISDLSPGTYRVKVFERRRDDAPAEYIASQVIKVQ
ncbi:MAG: hypothetical protein ABIS03_04260 [Gemmatimonadaceae bacterium]